MERVKLTDTETTLYAQFKELYKKSFPLFEQRTEKQQSSAFSSARYQLDAYIENGTLTGFISYWIFDAYIYIEHFAIHDQNRGKGYGSMLLKEFIEKNNKTIILEIDPVTDEISASRLKFYQNCDFYVNDYHHIHPPYRTGEKGHSLVVLSSGRTISVHEYDCFNRELRETVMRVPGYIPHTKVHSLTEDKV